MQLRNEPTEYFGEEIQVELDEQDVCDLIELYVRKKLSIQSKEKFYQSIDKQNPTLDNLKDGLFYAIINDIVQESLTEQFEKLELEIEEGNAKVTSI